MLMPTSYGDLDAEYRRLFVGLTTIGLALLDRAVVAASSLVEVEAPGGHCRAAITTLPFM